MANHPASSDANRTLVRDGARRRRWVRRLRESAGMFAVIVAGFLLASALHESEIVQRINNLVFDQYQRWKPRVWTPDMQVRVADIDDTTLERIGQWPWPRQRIAELTDKLAQAGAAAIVFDALFSEQDRYAPRELLTHLPPLPERDALLRAMQEQRLLDADPLAAAFARAPVVAAAALTDLPVRDRPEVKASFVTLGDNPRPMLPHFENMVMPLPQLRAVVQGLGVINYIPDLDQVVRRVPTAFAVGPRGSEIIAPSLGVEALRVALRTTTPIIKSTNASGEQTFNDKKAIVAVGIGDAAFPTEADGNVRVHFAGAQPGRRIPAWKILSGEASPKDLENTIVLIGSSAAALADLRATPLQSAVPGVEVHAEFLEHVLSGSQLVRPDWAWGAEAMAVVLGGLLIALLVRSLPPVLAAGAAALLLGAGLAASWQAFAQADLLFDPIIPGATWLAVHAITTVGVFRRTARERREVRTAFSRYLSPVVVEQIAADPSKLRLGGEMRNVTILFSDVRDFTARSETMTGAGVVRFLNALHTPLTDIVMASGGTIDKYLGDGLMAFWNAPLDTPDHATAACRAALAMTAAVPAIDAKLRAEALAEGREHRPLRIGIGLNTGDAFVGNMGSEQRFDYSIVGDPVNVAARLEAATKEFLAPIIVSESTRRAARGFLFVDLGPADLKGKAARSRLFALHCAETDAAPDWETFCARHEAVMSASPSDRSQLQRLVAEAQGTPTGAHYAGLYARLLKGEKTAIAEAIQAGGS